MLNLLSTGLSNSNEDYKNYRWFFTSEGKLVVGGKSDEQNEEVIRNFLRPDYVIMHTSLPGSPFMIIQSDNPSKKDLKETAVFCASFSKQWKNGNKNIDVDTFKGSQIYKTRGMKTGTFGVKGDKETIKVKPELVLVIQKGKIKAVPEKGKEKILAKIKPGKLSKEQAAEKIAKIIRDKFHLPVHKDEVMQAIPSDKIDVK
ncbi:MAG: NFACT RNA binding domain-containing protein [Candidatus Nanoarchaeia archaeon]|nr:NFACT RNA binding domain-containing protein [Candidatus Nanoarchaeia archaeon]MDD5740948.1 NFACT RNA binding domain-containing protein [Candidatus Nanoarchaeia archaeon]